MRVHPLDAARERRFQEQRRRKSGAPRDLSLAALPTGLEWLAWTRAKLDGVLCLEGWERFLVDAALCLQQRQVTLARQVRHVQSRHSMLRYNSEGYVWGEETVGPAAGAREALGWFIRNRPDPRACPRWAQIVLKAIEGCFLQQARLGNELEALRKTGYQMVNVSATQDPDRFAGEEVAR